jgi:hypothetical protein
MQTLSLALQSCLVDDDNDNDNDNKIKHSASEPVIKTDKSKTLITENDHDDDDDDDDDDDIWCNQEDEDNLEHRVKLDEEKEKHLREVLGDETFEIVRQALKVCKNLDDISEEIFPLFFFRIMKVILKF